MTSFEKTGADCQVDNEKDQAALELLNVSFYLYY